MRMLGFFWKIFWCFLRFFRYFTKKILKNAGNAQNLFDFEFYLNIIYIYNVILYYNFNGV